MNTHQSPSYSPACPPLNAIIIYDNFSSGLRAKRAVELVANEFGDGEAVSEAIWRTDLLDCPKVADSVALAAKNADFIVFSLQGDRVPAFGVLQCIETILETSNGSLGLFMLFGSDPTKSRVAKAARSYFHCRCESKGIAFFSHGYSTLGSEKREQALEPALDLMCLPVGCS